jgi:dihydrofolate synthase / folylpolyglutamate synthase
VRPGSLGLFGHHQRQNAALACALLEQASLRGLSVTQAHAEEGLRLAQWPGRLQLVGERPFTLLDGAHNPHAARALAQALPEVLRERGAPPKVIAVLGLLADKDAAGVLGPLLPLCEKVIACAPRSPRALPAAELAAAVQRLAPALACEVVPSGPEALQRARAEAGAQGAVLACGSLYLVGELLDFLEGRAAAAMPSEQLRPSSPWR